MGRTLRRGYRAVSESESGHRYGRITASPRNRVGRRGCRARSRLRGCRLLCNGPTRCFPQCGHDECAVRRGVGTALGTADVASGGGSVGGPRLAHPTPKALPTYFATPQANDDMSAPPQGLHEFMRAYFHSKSGEHQDNSPCLTDSELSVFVAEYQRTGFQGGLQWYRIRTNAAYLAELAFLTGCTISVPACFIAGERDWGIHQPRGHFVRWSR